MPFLARAQVEIDIPAAKQQAVQKIAVVPVQGDSAQEMDYIISSDLHKSGLFQPIAPNRLPGRPTEPSQIDYSAFAGIGANYVVLGRMLGGGQAQFVLSQVNNQNIVFNERISGGDKRAVAHRAADLILYYLTGKKGVFSTKIAFVLEQGGGTSRRYSLIVADIDGANRRTIASSNEPILSPAWSPDGSQIAYMTYANHHAQIVVTSASGGGGRVVVQSETTSSAPAWSPDGSQLAVALADKQGNTDIYLVSAGGGGKKRLTDHPAIDTEPVFSPDGGSIYFTSDRGGSPQIYKVSRSGGAAQRAVVGGKFSANASLSPDGKYMALTRQSGGGYQIGLYALQGGSFTALTNGRLDEGASFAPNGEFIIYGSREGGKRVLKMVNLKGEVVQTLSDSSGKLRDPAWSPK
ncbi:MAG: Tol-Pal system beta propeller repeat protein TolB [Cardiobacteriaceae bacterium]|nr:Tol-Pal system beta propeller repeat protein TolB [Cardiobacteriaceae bacterium]